MTLRLAQASRSRSNRRTKLRRSNNTMTSASIKRGFILTWLCCFLCATTAYALDPTKAITQYVHDVWTNKNGLPQSSILCMTQTRDGYLWLGTFEGLARFDGVRFTVFDKSNTKALPSRWITTLAEDQEGSLWIGTDGSGLIRYKDREFTNLTEQYKLALGDINKILPDQDGSLWIGSAQGLHQFKSGKLTTWTTQEGLSHNQVLTLHKDKSGQLWVGTYAGVDRFANGRFTHFSARDGLAPGRVRAICEDHNGALWFGTRGSEDLSKGGLTSFKEGKFKSYALQGESLFGAVASILEDSDGSLWIGTYYRGLYRFRNGRFDAYSNKDSLTDDDVPSLYEDHEGSLWVGSYIGLNRLRDASFIVYDKTNGLPHNIVGSIYEDRQGAIWIASGYNGLTRFQNGVFTNFTTKDGLASNEILAIREDHSGQLWVGTRSGLKRYQNGRFVNHPAIATLKNKSVHALEFTPSGDLWIGTSGGLFLLQQNKLIPFLSSKELGADLADVLYLDREQNLWIGTDRTVLKLHNRELQNITPEIGTPINADAFYEDGEGFIWIGMSDALYRYKNGKLAACRAQDGLFEDAAFCILEDSQGNFWTSGNKAIYRIVRQDLMDFADGKIQSLKYVTYGIADGLKNSETAGGAWKTRDGKLWFPTIAGAAVIDPAKLRRNELPPPVIIEQAIADSTRFSLAQSQSLAAGTQNLEFQYAGLSLVAAEKNQYKYQLVGYDKAWIDAGNRRTAYYTNLPPGNYTFRVIAANNDGVWNATGAAYSFSLKPYFWQTWWFYGLCIGGFVLAGFGLNNLRTKRVMAHEREKSQLKIAELRLEKSQVQAKALEAEHNRKTQELEEARRLQLSMLPKGNVRLERLEITGAMRTATEVGGDYYDFLPLPDGRYCVVIGDATGHGMSAGLIVGMVKMGLTSRLQAQPELQPMIEDLNAALKQSLAHRGVGMCLGATIIDPVTLAVELCSNGMPYPYHFKRADGSLHPIVLKAQPLGFLKRVNVPTATLQLQTGDALIWVSDGFEERMNAHNEEWGSQQVAAALTEICRRETSGEEIARELIAACDGASDGRNNNDDMTVVIVKVLSDGQSTNSPRTDAETQGKLQ